MNIDRNLCDPWYIKSIDQNNEPNIVEHHDTLDIEAQAVSQIARMLGFNTEPSKYPCAWGHISAGDKIANYQCLWNARAVSCYPLALKSTAEKLQIKLKVAPNSQQLLNHCSSWKCQNFCIEEVLTLQKYCYQQIVDKQGVQSAKNFFKQVELNRIEHMGMASFFAEHWDAKQPLFLVPSTSHQSWEKALQLLGFGTSQMIKLNVNNRMRVDIASLERLLTHAEQTKIPILAVVGILGTDDFGSIDPISEMIKLRDEFSFKGLNFYFHIDATSGGYLCSAFRNKDNDLISIHKLQKRFKYFPSQTIYDAIDAVNEADSVSISPSGTGHLSTETSSFIGKNQNIVNILSENNMYTSEAPFDINKQLKLISSNIIPYSKDLATSYYLTHKLIPLNDQNLGQLISKTIHAQEYFFKRLKKMIKRLSDQVNVAIPMEPDSNIFCIAINPINNNCLTRMNRFSRRVYKQLFDLPIEDHLKNHFFCTSTSLLHSNLGNDDVQYLLQKLGINNSSFVINIEDPKVQTNSIYVLRHTFLNSSLLTKIDGKNAIDNYCDYLEQVIRDVVKKESSTMLMTVGAS